ncbi:MEMO1 family protein [Patescibacteria group bacterium]|nr:MEMO1 family protein [Patescibacteria group bacterium]
MPLKSAYLLPHSPLLVPEIAKANHSFFDKTIKAYQAAAIKMKNQEVEILIILSPHSSLDKKTFQLNVAPEMEVDLKEFGFIPPKTLFTGAAVLADRINESLKDEFPLRLSSENLMDYGSAIPAYLLRQENFNPRILTISLADELEKELQLKFSQALGKIITESEKNIAIIASGDLSHRLQKKSPGGYSSKAAKFDNKIIELISDQETALEEILKLDNKITEITGECASVPLTGLLGVLSSINFETEILAYQTEFGVGYLSAEFILKD